MKEKKLSKLEKSWILYDVGNSAFVLLISTIIPIYFNYLAGEAGLSSTQYLSYWGYAASIVTVIVAFTGPVLGTIADYKNMKKPLFGLFMFLGVAGCMGLGFCNGWLVFLVVFIISKIGFQSSIIFYDSMIQDVTSEENLDNVSSQGFAWGYIGSCIPFILSLGIVLGKERLGISMTTAMMLSFFIVAIWWLGMSIPIFRNFEQLHFVKRGDHFIGDSFRRLGKTVGSMKENKKIFLFLLAYFFYIDGVYTIIDMATAYGTALGLNTTGLLLALLVTQIVAFPSAILFGRLSEKTPSEKLIIICIFAYTGITLFAVFMTTQLHFWILAVCVGLFQGGIQALSRSYFAKIIPAEKSGEYFGLLDICGKGASFLGTMLVSVVTQITGNQSLGISVMLLVFIVGLLLFSCSIKETDCARGKEKIEFI